MGIPQDGWRSTDRMMVRPRSWTILLDSVQGVTCRAPGFARTSRVVLVLSTRTRRSEMPKVRATTAATLLLMPWPISMPPVVTLTLPSA